MRRFVSPEADMAHMNSKHLAAYLQECLDASTFSSAKLHYQVTESADTENISTNMLVCFEDSGPNRSICLTQLVELLREKAAVGSIEVFGPPARHVVLFGAAEGKNYKIVIQL